MTWLDDLTLDTVIVHTTEGMTFKGLKSSVYDDSMVLREVRVLQEDGATEQLNGDIAIPRERVHFVQLLATESA